MFSTRTRTTVGLVASATMVLGGLLLVAPASAEENGPAPETTTVVEEGTPETGGHRSRASYTVTFVARTCTQYTDVFANRSRNNIMESLENLGLDTNYA